MLAVSHLQVRGKKPIEINDADVAELVDARDLKSNRAVENANEFCQTTTDFTTQTDRTNPDLSNDLGR